MRNKNVVACVGLGSGDEAKSRCVDYIVSRYNEENLVLRQNGTQNAGPRVINDYGRLDLHGVPAGICNKNSMNLMGAGTALNPDFLKKEMDELRSKGLSLANYFISSRSHIVMPYHLLLDGIEEKNRKGKEVIGTTARGSGPVYFFKSARRGIRFGDLLYSTDNLYKKVKNSVDFANIFMKHYSLKEYAVEEIVEVCLNWKEMLKDRIVDCYEIVQRFLEEGKPITVEGQLGIDKDLQWGLNYPIVTSSGPISDLSGGTGIPVNRFDEIIGIMKLYTTVSGGGHLIAEMAPEEAARIRELGNERGVTTGRDRRIGYCDLVMSRYGVKIAGVTKLAITKVDILDGEEKIKLCVGYKKNNKIYHDMPDPFCLEEYEPVYQDCAGWNSSTKNCRKWEDLPENARVLMKDVSHFLGCSITYISVGAERNSIIDLNL